MFASGIRRVVRFPSMGIPVVGRRFSENSSSSAAKSARFARKGKVIDVKSSSGPLMTPFRISIIASLGIAGYCVYDIKTNKQGSLGTMYYGSEMEKFMLWLYAETLGRFQEMYFPYDNKLLPDWPSAPCYGNPPPGTPAPPLLVIDLEKTLIGSEYDARYGWRHVKRPGLDQFLEKISAYYEIVIFSENDIGAVAEVMFAIDPGSVCHKLGSAAAEARDGLMIKRLDYMNRDISRIILIDDNPEAFQLFPRNTLQVKPFNDVKDSTDRVLYDLVPLLQAFIHDDSKDFRDTLDDLGTHEAEEAVIEWKMRVSEKKTEENKKRNMGLGGLVRARFVDKQIGSSKQATSNQSSGNDDGENRLISLSQLVGGVDDSLSGTHGSSHTQDKGIKTELKGSNCTLLCLLLCPCDINPHSLSLTMHTLTNPTNDNDNDRFWWNYTDTWYGSYIITSTKRNGNKNKRSFF